jgi:hypothetical protein
VRHGESPNDVVGWFVFKIFLIVLLVIFALHACACSIFNPVQGQGGIIPPLCRGCYYVTDTSDSLPLISTPHRMIVWRDWNKDNDGYHFAPETSEPNIFTTLQNLPATLGSAVPTAAGTAIGK